ncbi:hypothetical protein GCM10029992_39370 [Glycomyces albus]
MRGVSFTRHPDQLKFLEEHLRGESDLVCRNGKWYLLATVEMPDAAANDDPVDVLGVDMGIVNIATSSDGDNYEGAGLRRYRKRMAKVRAELQAKATKSAKKKLKRRAKRRRGPSRTAIIGSRSSSLKWLNAPVAVSAWKTLLVSATGYGWQLPSEASSTRGPSTNSRPSSPTRPNGPESPWWSSTRGTPRGGARDAGTPPRPIDPAEMISPVSAADSLEPPTR